MATIPSFPNPETLKLRMQSAEKETWLHMAEAKPNHCGKEPKEHWRNT